MVAKNVTKGPQSMLHLLDCSFCHLFWYCHCMCEKSHDRTVPIWIIQAAWKVSSVIYQERCVKEAADCRHPCWKINWYVSLFWGRFLSVLFLSISAKQRVWKNPLCFYSEGLTPKRADTHWCFWKLKTFLPWNVIVSALKEISAWCFTFNIRPFIPKNSENQQPNHEILSLTSHFNGVILTLTLLKNLVYLWGTGANCLSSLWYFHIIQFVVEEIGLKLPREQIIHCHWLFMTLLIF